ncbi:MAG: hypothetical protein A2289_20525 [Deltaproteobacteria bacterium RIFOXYA12_FULL_58_15]|nr:MAG: hypothetical protein A2289_20525 [Deltaproteobacteria bacterium RIFOXYA12_FULL_58_15]OGR14069.1 MAG: hypothetical protein A2341_19230 [Deltaproteobacteria bacterium RIFOXYB12_FULL_58_9]
MTDRIALIAALFERAKAWLASHAPLLAENLAEGASEEQLAKVERQSGFKLPPDLRALWSIHNGQRDELNGFVETLDLFDTKLALAYRTDAYQWIKFHMEMEPSWDQPGITEEEARSEHWLPLAGRDSEFMVVN